MQNLISEADDLSRARSTGITFALILAVASLLNFLRWRSFDPVMDISWASSFGFFVFMGLCLYLVKKPNAILNSALFWLGFAVAAAGIAVANRILVERLDNFTPYGGFKLMAMGIAIVAPFPYRNGFIAIFLCALIPVLMHVTVLKPLQSKIPLPEPGIAVVACVVALCGLVFRLRGIKIERENARLRAEKENLNEFSRILLVLRDLTNTPLQVIELTTQLMKSGQISPEEAAEHLHVSVEKLTLISDLLSKHQFGDIPETQMNKLYDTNDPMVFLQKRLNQLKSKASVSKN